MTIPLDQPATLDATATFTLVAALDNPPKYAGEAVTTARVTAGLDGGSRTTYFTAGGVEVPEAEVVALGLGR